MKPLKNKKGNQNLSKVDERKIALYAKVKKLSTRSPVKDRTKFEHRHKVVYFSHCANVTCNETFLRETRKQINECIKLGSH